MKLFVILLVYTLIILMKRRCLVKSTVINYSVLTDHPGDFNIEIYLETTNALSTFPPHPVLIFFPGFDDIVPSSIYSQILTKIVQQTDNNLIIIGINQQQSLNPNVIAENIKLFFDYISNSTNARNIFLPLYPDVILDIDNRLGVLACESATQSIAVYLNQECGPVKLLSIMDPTDTLYGLYSGQATNTTLVNGHLPFHTPTLIITNGLVGSSYSIGETLTGPCSPNNLSNQLFFNVLSGSPKTPLFLVNFTEYGLGDILNRPLILAVKSLVCDTCSFHPNFNCNYEQHQNHVAFLLSKFINAIFNKNQTDLIAVEEANQYFENVTQKYQLNDYNLTEQGAFCTHD